MGVAVVGSSSFAPALGGRPEAERFPSGSALYLAFNGIRGSFTFLFTDLFAPKSDNCLFGGFLFRSLFKPLLD